MWYVELPWYERWQTFVACGMACLLGSPFVFWQLAEWEAEPASRSISMHWLAALIYRLGGKWLLSALVLAVGCIVTVMGIRRRRLQTARQRLCDHSVPGASKDNENTE